MDAYSDVITDLVFTKTENWSFDKVRLNHVMLSILFELDGSKSIGAVARAVNIPELTTRSVVNQLHELGLIRLIRPREKRVKTERKTGVYRGVPFNMGSV